MATSARLIRPARWALALSGGALASFLFAGALLLQQSRRESSRLARSELELLSRAARDRLARGDYRAFLESAGDGFKQFRIESLDPSHPFALGSAPRLPACAETTGLRLCRETPIPWAPLAGLAGILAAAAAFGIGIAIRKSREEDRAAQLREIEEARSRAREELAAQLAHDIRSPLAALSAVERNLVGLPAETRDLLTHATGRIHSIAESLLDRQRPARAIGLTKTLSHLVREKRVEHDHRASISFDSGACEASVTIREPDLSRALSNLINNSIEAGARSIRIALGVRGSSARITILDDGGGMPADVLARLGERGLSVGKTNGNGLGISQGFALARDAGGELRFESPPPDGGRGTLATLELPLAEGRAPVASSALEPASPSMAAEARPTAEPGVAAFADEWNWGADSLESAFPSAARFVVAGTAQAAWGEHLARMGRTLLRGFDDAASLRGWFSREGWEETEAYYLLDADLGPTGSALDAIDRLGIRERSAIVEGKTPDGALAQRCETLGVRLLPRSALARC